MSPPEPALVIAVGPLAQAAVQSVRAIYLRGDPRRQAVTLFYALGGGVDDLDSLPRLAELPALTGDGDPARLSQEAYHSIIEQGSAVRTALERALHAVRTHDNLLAAGWPAGQNVPVNIFVVADLTDAWTVGCLLPVVALLRAAGSVDWMCRAFLLLNTGVFPTGFLEEIRSQEARVLQALNDLRALLDARTAQWQKLSQALELPEPAGLPPVIFLFDRRKEGSAEVKDRDSMAVLLGNGLLALIEGSTARRLSESQNLEEGVTYHSIGVSLVVYDPETAQRNCAARAAADFVQTWLLAEPAANLEQVRLLDQVCGNLGKPTDWLAALVGALPQEAGNIAPGTGSLSLSVRLTRPVFQPLDYENLAGTGWDVQLLAQAGYLEETLLPLLQQAAGKETLLLQESLSARLRCDLRSLIRLPRLYPGGLRAAGFVLAEMNARLQAYQTEIERAAEQAQAGAGFDAAVGDTAKQIRAVISAIPKLPRVFRWLPHRIRSKAAAAFYLWKHRRRIQALLNLRSQAVQLLEGHCAQAAAITLLRCLQEIVQDLLKTASQAAEELDRLQTAVCGAAAALEDYCVARDDDRRGLDGLYRSPAASAGWLDAVYQRALPNFDLWLIDLLASEAIFVQQNASVFADLLHRQSTDAFQWLWDCSVDQVLMEQAVDAAQLHEKQIAAALPPLRPDFDASGGSMFARTAAGLTGLPGWQLCQLPEDALARLEIRFTGNPYIALWFQVRGAIPPAAVETVLSAGHDLEDLGCWSVLNDSMITDSGNLTAGSARLLFSWTFRPRGGKEDILQQISLVLDRARLERYRRLPRLNGQWNIYAQAEMPEIRDLALAFHNLHARRRWSTYTQASNVLAFVQQCIPYARDIDTTGHTDWPRYPIETLADQTGDCEDVAILCAGVLARLGFQVVLLVYENHVAFAVAGAEKLKGDYIVNPVSGTRCFYGEATANGWHLGEVPKSYAGKAPLQVLPVTILLDEESEDEPVEH